MNKHLLQLLFALLVLPAIGQVKYSQDFEGSTADMTFIDQDKKNPNSQVASFKGSWNVRSLDGNKWATANSWFATAAKADDWMITPIIKDIKANTYLTWKAFASDPQYRDDYEVRISEGGNTIADFKTVLLTVNEESADIIERAIALGAYEGKEIRIAFRNISFDKFLLNIDDISVFDAKAIDLSMEGASIRNYILKGNSEEISFQIKNNGYTPITSFEAEWTDGIQTFKETFNNVDVQPFSTYNTKFTTKFTPTDADVTDFTAKIVSVNGGANESANITANFTSHGVLENIQRKMLVEEATGTWCIWCPRGAVNMAKMRKNYPGEFIGIAVHNNDPMVNTDYDDGLTSLDGFGGFPSVIINRERIEDPADMESILKSDVRKDVAPAIVEMSSKLNGRTLTIDATVKFNASFKGETLKLIGVLIEDEVTGTGADYDQANIYANNANGVMGGYEKLPNPVPANQMVYNEVARDLLYGFEGKDINAGADIAAGDEISYLFDHEVSADYDVNKVTMILMVADGTGVIIGADEAQASPTSTNEINLVAEDITLFPNPATDASYLSISLKESNDVSVQIFNQIGQVIAAKNYGKLTGKQVLPINSQDFNAGMYLVKLSIGGHSTTQKLIVK